MGLEVAEATYRTAVARWPRARITLRQGIRALDEVEDLPLELCAAIETALKE